MKNGWLNLDLLEFLSALPFLVFLFIKCEEISSYRFGIFHWRDFHLKANNIKPQSINVGEK